MDGIWLKVTAIGKIQAQNNLTFTRIALMKAPAILGAIRIWESLFALPFAYIGMLLAADGWPGLGIFIWITIAMICARTLGMSANRLIHRKEDSANPRTADRHLPQGVLKPWEVLMMLALSSGIFFFAATQLNQLSMVLAPVTAAYVIIYSYTKYYTWGCHFILGGALGIAPAAAWIGVTGRLDPEAVLLSFAVATWASGFDIIYSCADWDFDGIYHIHSIPRRFGIAVALWIAKGLHVLTVTSLLALGFWLNLNLFYYVGCIMAAILLIYENSLVKPDNLTKLNRAFFKLNSSVAAQLLILTVLAIGL
jgi:4-hydroxybenzoate polyprenyltransferase